MEKSKILFKDSLMFVKSNFWRLFALLILLGAFQIFIGSTVSLLDELGNSFQIVAIKMFFLFIYYGINFWIASIIYMFISQKINNNEVKLSDLFVFDKRKIWNLYVVVILSGLIVCAGFVLLIIPGVILSITLYFAFYLVVLKNIKPLDAIIHSFNMVWGRTWTFISKSLYPVLYFLLLFMLSGIALALSFSLVMISKILAIVFFVVSIVFSLYFFIKLTLSFYVYYVKLFYEFEKTAPVLEQTRFDILKKRFIILACIGLIVPIGFAVLFALI